MRTQKSGGGEPVNLGEWKCIRETERALLVTSDTEPERWIPKSVVHDDSEVWGASEERCSGDLIVLRWWAEEHNLA